jgi:hypothetical protein
MHVVLEVKYNVTCLKMHAALTPCKSGLDIGLICNYKFLLGRENLHAQMIHANYFHQIQA